MTPPTCATGSAASFGLKGECAEKFFRSVCGLPDAQKITNDFSVYDNVRGAYQDHGCYAPVARSEVSVNALRTAQVEWFEQNMPDVYEKY